MPPLLPRRRRSRRNSGATSRARRGRASVRSDGWMSAWRCCEKPNKRWRCPRSPLFATDWKVRYGQTLGTPSTPPRHPLGTERTANQRHVAYDTRRGNGGRAVLQPLRRLAKEGLARAACVYYASKKCRRLQLTTRSLRRPARTRGGHSVGWHG